MHEDPVLAYMQSRNRPYSVQNVFDNLRGEIPKTKVSVSLESGVESGVLFAKMYGAQKIYCVKQDVAPKPLPDMEDDSVEMQKEYDELVAAVMTESDVLETLRRKSSLTNRYKSLVQKEETLLERIRSMHQQISILESSNQTNDSPFADIGDELRVTFDKVSQEFSKRKRLANELLGFVSETADMSRRDLIEELGLDSVQPVISPSRGC